MDSPLIVVLDVGKTLAKLSLFDGEGRLVARETRRNARLDGGGYLGLDVEGVEAWMAQVLRRFAARGQIVAIVPVAHGAAVAVLRDGALACLPPDYEQGPPAAMRAAYRAGRDAFADTGSPLLPDGLNIGLQLHWLEQLRPGLLSAGATLVTWPQYWAWRLCGIVASEVTSLGCHSDLWFASTAQPSDMARARGWARLLAPLRRADEVLGVVTSEWVARAGLSPGVKVYCGLHDSNAALLAARGARAGQRGGTTVVSTGTWFVAMRAPASQSLGSPPVPEGRDCLVNIDPWGAAVPSARWMGGRELEILLGDEASTPGGEAEGAALLDAASRVIDSRAMALPSFAPGTGPFPEGRGRWLDRPMDRAAVQASAWLYAALVTDAALDLIGTRERVVVEGRFAQADVFVRALAALRPRAVIQRGGPDHDASFGALGLALPRLAALVRWDRVTPLAIDLTDYARQWRGLAGGPWGRLTGATGLDRGGPGFDDDLY